MREALKEAENAVEDDEGPVGSLVTAGNRIIGKGHNLTERLNDVTAHAEMQAMTAAAGYLRGKYLDECPLYITLEPCVMFAGAAFWFQMREIVFGAHHPHMWFAQLVKPLFHPLTLLPVSILETSFFFFSLFFFLYSLLH